MRGRIGFLAVAALVVALGAVPALRASGEDTAGLQSAVFEVEGMTCGGCAAGLEKMLAAMDGIASARVSYEEGRAWVELDPAKIEPAALAEGMSKAGMPATYLAAESGAVPAKAPGGHVCSDDCDHGHHAEGSHDHDGADCAGPGHLEAGSGPPQLSDDDMDRVAIFVVGQLVEQDAEPTAISRDQIAEATGISVPDSDLYRLQNEVIGRLRADHPMVLERLTEGNRCAEYGACSLQGNLAGASGDILEMYEREKAEDGARFDDMRLPDFEARDLSDNVVRSADLTGRPTVLVLLAGHCFHCHDSLPFLQEAVDTWGPEGVQVVGIVINSGSVKDVNEWIPETNPTYEVWVDNDESIAEDLGSHLVPSYFFVNADGYVMEKLVGFKERGVVLKKVSELAASGRTPRKKDATASLGSR